MEKLDLKDRKILYHLDIDSRQSFAQIGKKVGLHKDSVALRVKKLQKKGIIKNFITMIDDYRLGFASYRYYLKYQYTTPELRKEIIDYFVKNKQVRFTHSTEGYYDLTLITDVNDAAKCYIVWDKVLSKYRNYFANQVFSVFFKQCHYNHSFLIDKKEEQCPNRLLYNLYDIGKTHVIDHIDYQILKLMTQNSRIPLIDIATKLNTNAITIKNRIKKLEKSEIIKGHRLSIDFPKIGYHRYKCDIVLKDHKILPKILRYIEANPNLNQIILPIGYVDIELVFILQNSEQLHEIMQDLSKKFPETIKDYIYTIILKRHKWDFLPEVYPEKEHLTEGT